MRTSGRLLLWKFPGAAPFEVKAQESESQTMRNINFCLQDMMQVWGGQTIWTGDSWQGLYRKKGSYGTEKKAWAAQDKYRRSAQVWTDWIKKTKD